MPCTVILSTLIDTLTQCTRLRRTPLGARATLPNTGRRLSTVTLAANGGVLLVETGTRRVSLPATGTLSSVTVDARRLTKHLRHHVGQVELSNDGGLAISGRGFRSVVPVK